MKTRAREAARNFLRPRHITSILWTAANGKRGEVTSMWVAAVVQADSCHWKRREEEGRGGKSRLEKETRCSIDNYSSAQRLLLPKQNIFKMPNPINLLKLLKDY